MDYYWTPSFFIPGTGFYSLRPWRFSPGGHGAVIVEAILFDFSLDAIVFFIPGHHCVLLLETLVCVFLATTQCNSWRPWCFNAGDRDVLFLETIAFYS